MSYLSILPIELEAELIILHHPSTNLVSNRNIFRRNGFKLAISKIHDIPLKLLDDLSNSVTSDQHELSEKTPLSIHPECNLIYLFRINKFDVMTLSGRTYQETAIKIKSVTLLAYFCDKYHVQSLDYLCVNSINDSSLECFKYLFALAPDPGQLLSYLKKHMFYNRISHLTLEMGRYLVQQEIITFKTIIDNICKLSWSERQSSFNRQDFSNDR